MNYRRLAVPCSMSGYMSFSGKDYKMSLPCTVYGLYIESTGTLLLESVWCDGTTYYPDEFEKAELNKFNEALAEALLYGEF